MFDNEQCRPILNTPILDMQVNSSPLPLVTSRTSDPSSVLLSEAG
jgi:hypothetical protein